jgi:hypothetical protein
MLNNTAYPTMNDFASAKSFLFVYENALSKDDIELIHQFAMEIKAEKKDVFFLVYHDFKKVPETVIMKSFDIHVCKKDFNFLKRPASSLAKRHAGIAYDYLISFLDNRNERLEQFIRKSKAGAKIGRFEPDNKNLYRITFSSKELNKNMEEFLGMTGTYLTKIKIVK